MSAADDSWLAIAHTLGDVNRDFKEDPLTATEIEAIIYTYSQELDRKDLPQDLRNIYVLCLEILKKHIIFH